MTQIGKLKGNMFHLIEIFTTLIGQAKDDPFPGGP